MARISPTGRTPSVPPPHGDKKEKKALVNIKDKVARAAHIRSPIPAIQKTPPSGAKGLVKRIGKAFNRMQPALAKL